MRVGGLGFSGPAFTMMIAFLVLGQQNYLYDADPRIARSCKGMPGTPIETGLLLRNLNEVTEVSKPN